MKRDMDLVRKILMAIEASPLSVNSHEVELPDADDQVVSYHIMILNEAGLLVGIDVSDNERIRWLAVRLTWDGHDFVEAARDDTRWAKAKRTITERGGVMLVEVLKQLLVQFARDAVFQSRV